MLYSSHGNTSRESRDSDNGKNDYKLLAAMAARSEAERKSKLEEISILPESLDLAYVQTMMLIHTHESRQDVFVKVNDKMDFMVCTWGCEVYAFHKVRNMVPSILSLIRNSAWWNIVEKEYMDDIKEILKYLHQVSLEAPSELVLIKEETAHLYALYTLLMVTDGDYEMILEIISNCGKRESAEYFVELLKTAVCHRGNIAQILCSIICGHRARIKRSWVDDSFLSSVCDAYSYVLNDNRVSTESRGHIIRCALRLVEDSSWGDIVYRHIIDAMRRADVSGDIDHDIAGRYEDVLFQICRAKARIASIASNSLPPTKGFVEQDNKTDYERIKHDAVLYQEIKYARTLLQEEYSRNPAGISRCRCAEPKVHVICQYEIADVLDAQYQDQSLRVGKYLKQDNFKKALEWSHKTLETVDAMLRVKHVIGFNNYAKRISKFVNLVHGDCFGHMEKFEEAISYYTNVFGSYADGDMKVGENGAFAAQSCMYLLAQVGREDEAIALARALSNARKAADVSDPFDFDFEVIRRASLQFLQEHTVARQPIVKAANVQNNPALGAVFVCSAPALMIENIVETCLWKQLDAPVHPDDDDDVITQVLVVPRLKWALLWVEHEMMIWNVSHDIAVQWFTLDNWVVESTPMVFDLVDDGILLLFIVKNEDFPVVVNLIDINPGDTTSFQTSVALFKKKLNANKLSLLTKTLTNAVSISHNNRGPSGEGDWKVAICYNEKAASVLKGARGIAVFSNIVPGSPLGPFNFRSEVPNFVISLEPVVYTTIFLPTSSFLITASAANEVQIWDAFSPIKSGTVPVHTIKNNSEYVVKDSIVVSSSFIFMSSLPPANPNDNQPKDDPFSPEIISVWSTVDLKRIASLICIEAVQSLHLIKRDFPEDVDRRCQYELFSSHVDGIINVWTFYDFDWNIELLDNIPILEIAPTISIQSSAASTPILYMSSLHKMSTMSILVANTDGLSNIWLSELEGKHGFIKNPILPSNCGYCGKWSYKAINRCGLCMRINYCDQTCQKNDWKRHKPDCKQKAGF